MKTLPSGQRVRNDFPRFGLSPYAIRFPSVLDSRAIDISGDALSVEKQPGLTEANIRLDPFEGVAAMSLMCDFHCVTTWTVCNQQWQGVRFCDFYTTHVAPRIRDDRPAKWIVLRGQDGYRTALPLQDALGGDVMLVHSLNGQPLSVEHGAPLRFIAPQHYGYKSMKHLKAIEFWHDEPVLKRGLKAWMDHPRARVALEERGQVLPGWLLRYLYRPFIASNVRRFQLAMNRYKPR